ncbi:MAG: ABC transporter ATP-binding protein, partial [Candidatus Competibacteraceae bacterium]|nr:ABC transporter ATP-binding protein [Candidatus Competibacteraceae bacterium]
AEKPVCLMDEPLSNLDAKLRHEMRIEIRALQRKLGISMIYVTHDQAEAMSMADRVILLCNGRIEQDAPPDEIYQTPATLFAARFIGTPPMNILTLADGAGGAVIKGLAGPPVLAHSGAGLCLGVRPEDVQLGAADGLPATVRGVEYLGADSVVDCELGGQLLAVRTQGKTDLSAGDRVQVSWSTASVHVFDAASGHRRDLL